MSKWWLPIIAPIVGGAVTWWLSGSIHLSLWVFAAVFLGGLFEKYMGGR